MSEFKPGEIVDITIKGARVVDVAHLKDCEVGVSFECDYGEYGWAIPLGPPEVTVERVSPAEWPPRPGDVWLDAEGRAWTALRGRMFPVTSTRGESADAALAIYGPLTLVHREDEQGGGAS